MSEAVDTQSKLIEHIKEIATIQARLTAIEVVQKDIRPELDRLSSPNWSRYIAVSIGFLTFMGFYTGLIRSVQQSDSMTNAVGIRHLEDHIKIMADEHKRLQDNISSSVSSIRSDMFTTHEHEIFDRDRFEKLRLLENRLIWIEQNLHVRARP